MNITKALKEKSKYESNLSLNPPGNEVIIVPQIENEGLTVLALYNSGNYSLQLAKQHSSDGNFKLYSIPIR